jgi:hypothetical protein
MMVHLAYESLEDTVDNGTGSFAELEETLRKKQNLEQDRVLPAVGSLPHWEAFDAELSLASFLAYHGDQDEAREYFIRAKLSSLDADIQGRLYGDHEFALDENGEFLRDKHGEIIPLEFPTLTAKLFPGREYDKFVELDGKISAAKIKIFWKDYELAAINLMQAECLVEELGVEDSYSKIISDLERQVY